MGDKDKKVYKLLDLEIDEVSTVGDPASPGAVQMIWKSNDKEDVSKKGMLTDSVNGHQHLIDDYESMDGHAVESGTTTYDGKTESSSHNHAWVKNAVTGKVTIAENLNHAHKVKLNTVTKEDDKKEDIQEVEMTEKKTDQAAIDTQIKEAVDKAVKDSQAKNQVDIDRLTKESQMNDVTKAFYGDLNVDEKAVFLAKGAEDQVSLIEKSVEADEVLTVDGQQIRKSVVGDVSFAVFKSQEARIAKSEEVARLEKENRLFQEDIKKAADAWPNIKGTDIEKGSLFAIIHGIKNEDVKKYALEVFASANEVVSKTLYTELGSSAEFDINLDTPQGQYEAMAKALAKENGIKVGDAYIELAKTVEGKALYAQVKKAR